MKKILLLLVLLAALLSGCGGSGNSDSNDELQQIIDEQAAIIDELNLALYTYQNENTGLHRRVRELTLWADPQFHQGLHASEIRAAFLADEEFLAEIVDIAGFWPPYPFAEHTITVTPNHVFFPRGIVSYSVDITTRRITWTLEAYQLSWLGWRNVREAPASRMLTNFETVAIRIYRIDDVMSVYHQSTVEIPGENLWQEVTQMFNMRDL